MRSGLWRSGARGMLAVGLVAMLGVSTARASDIFGNFHTIPRSVPAVDLNTGGPFMAPPVPYGHYAKDPLGPLAKAAGLAASPFHKAAGMAHMLCGKCLGKGCGSCHGLGMIGKGCGDNSCGLCAGHGSIIKTSGCGLISCNDPHLPAASPQVAPGCGPYPTKGGFGCANKGGIGCGDPGMVSSCMSCGGKGCGLCGFKGLHCLGCGGKGCGLCMGFASKCKAALGAPAGMVMRALHIGDVKYFVGAGGPVPITPGYVPYVVPTRSPRDFFAFPPLGNGVQPDY